MSSAIQAPASLCPKIARAAELGRNALSSVCKRLPVYVGERPLKPQQKAAISACVRILRIVLGLRKTASRSFWALIDGRVPGRLKLVAVAAVLFVLSPLNLLGDIPVLGALDDAALLMLVLTWFTRASSPYLNTIDA